MKKIVNQLEELISPYSEKLLLPNEKYFSEKPFPEKWSRKEEFGHLIDSAHNNLRRFVVAQYEINPKIVYDQNFWNVTFCYQHQSTQDRIALWKLLNRQIFEVLKSTSEQNSKRLCNTGKEEPELHSIEWLAGDYVKHLLHHLHHILALNEIPY